MDSLSGWLATFFRRFLCSPPLSFLTLVFSSLPSLPLSYSTLTRRSLIRVVLVLLLNCTMAQDYDPAPTEAEQEYEDAYHRERMFGQYVLFRAKFWGVVVWLGRTLKALWGPFLWSVSALDLGRYRLTCRTFLGRHFSPSLWLSIPFP